MTLFNPKTENFDHLDLESKKIMKKTIDFFENRGKKRLKSDFHGKVWYEDFIEFLKENQSAFEASLPLNMGQLLSLPFILLGLWMLLRRNPKPDTMK